MKRLALALAAAAACGGHDAAPSPGSAAPPPVAAKAVAPAEPAAAAGSASGSADAAAAAATAARVKYRDAMRRGRVATDARRYDDAVAAFTDALAARPDDARALGERGFARLLGATIVDLPYAEQDLDDAAARTHDPKLLSEIWFNRGLVEDKRGEQENAVVDFFLANQLRPTTAAAARLAGKTVCPARVETSTAGLPGVADPDNRSKPIDAASWLALLHAMTFAIIDDAHPPRDDADARAALGVSSKKLPAIAVAGRAGSGRAAYLVAKHGDGVRAYPLGYDDGGRCAGQLDLAIAKIAGPIVLVHGSVLPEGGMTEMCHRSADDAEPIPCTGGSGEVDAGEACFAPAATLHDLAIDTATGKVVDVSRPVPTVDTAATRVTVQLAGAGSDSGSAAVKLSGVSCDRVVTWP